MKIPPLQNKPVGVSFTNGFSDPKSFRDFRDSGPRVENQQTQPTYDAECRNQTRQRELCHKKYSYSSAPGNDYFNGKVIGWY